MKKYQFKVSAVLRKYGVLIFLPLISFSCSNEITFYVSPDGDNENRGTQSKPFATIDRVDSTFLTVKDNFDFQDDEKQKLFVDPDNMDFTLKKDAMIFQLDSIFKPIDFNRFRK